MRTNPGIFACSRPTVLLHRVATPCVELIRIAFDIQIQIPLVRQIIDRAASRLWLAVAFLVGSLYTTVVDSKFKCNTFGQVIAVRFAFFQRNSLGHAGSRIRLAVTS